MRGYRTRLLASTATRTVLGAGMLALGAAVIPPAPPAAAAPLNLAQANPCAPAMNPCNPCAPKMNPCAAANPCTPAMNPCNPCAAAKPRKKKWPKGYNPCTPCAAANPCAPGANPCAAVNPCAPAMNPCNPCAANPCAPAASPCNPCAPRSQAAPLSDAQAKALYERLHEAMQQAYARSGLEIARIYRSWPRFSTGPYVSATHGGRYVQNYASPDGAEAYGRFEKVGRMPAGAILAKDSFVVQGGRARPGPLFLMEKLPAGTSPATGDWKYAMVTPDGRLVDEPRQVRFCADCHMSAADTDSLFFMPEKYRRRGS